MCGIAGAAGAINKLPARLKAEFHEFLSCLFTMSELRGRDAAGFWVWRDDHYVTEKRPIPAEELIQRSPRWKSLRFNPGSLYLLHTRAATDGDPNENINNHPHLGEHSVMIHNGMIWGHQGIVHKYNLKMKSDCDSEVILRLTEANECIKLGLKSMYDITRDATGAASIATAFVDRRKPDRIYLSRNTGNPCVIYKSRKFKCTFFVSTEDIFERAIDIMYKNKQLTNLGIVDKPETIIPWKLYNLHENGEYDYEYLTSSTNPTSSSYHPGYQNYAGYGHKEDDEDVAEDTDYIRCLMFGKAMTADIQGRMKLITSKFEKHDDDEDEEDDDDFIFEDDDDNCDSLSLKALDMPRHVEDDLRFYLQKKINDMETT